jgi:hypothetical protein
MNYITEKGLIVHSHTDYTGRIRLYVYRYDGDIIVLDELNRWRLP